MAAEAFAPAATNAAPAAPAGETPPMPAGPLLRVKRSADEAALDELAVMLPAAKRERRAGGGSSDGLTAANGAAGAKKARTVRFRRLGPEKPLAKGAGAKRSRICVDLVMAELLAGGGLQGAKEAARAPNGEQKADVPAARKEEQFVYDLFAPVAETEAIPPAGGVDAMDGTPAAPAFHGLGGLGGVGGISLPSPSPSPAPTPAPAPALWRVINVDAALLPAAAVAQLEVPLLEGDADDGAEEDDLYTDDDEGSVDYPSTPDSSLGDGRSSQGSVSDDDDGGVTEAGFADVLPFGVARRRILGGRRFAFDAKIDTDMNDG